MVGSWKSGGHGAEPLSREFSIEGRCGAFVRTSWQEKGWKWLEGRELGVSFCGRVEGYRGALVRTNAAYWSIWEWVGYASVDVGGWAGRS